MKVLLSLRTALLAAIALHLSQSARAADGAELSALRDQVRTLEQQLKILARQIELKDEASADAAKKTGVSTADAAGFSVGSTDKAHRLNFRVLAQADGRHYRLSPSLGLYSGAVSFVAEYIWEKQTLRQGAVLFDAAHTAWRANVGYVLSGEVATARGVVPREDFSPGASGWGAFELVARASGIDFDDDLFLAAKGNLTNSLTNANATGAKAYGAGLNWFLSRNLTLLFNYESTSFSGRTTRPDEHAVFTRAQINF